MVSTNDPDLETVHLYVRVEPDFGPLPCGTDEFYRSVLCEETARSTTEVLVRVSKNAKMPAVEGRFYDPQRKSVLVQVWGSSGSRAQAFVRGLLNDALLGAVTTTALNEKGDAIDDFETLESEVVVSQE